jgi:hypothetical protein
LSLDALALLAILRLHPAALVILKFFPAVFATSKFHLA